MMLNYGYETGQLTLGTFVPSGIHLTANVATYKGLLRRQNKFISSVSAVMISWMSEGAVMQHITYKGTQTCLAKIFLDKKWCDFEQPKRTKKTDEEGKWFLSYRKTQFDAVIEFINVALPELYIQVLPKYKY
eukprot:8576871-Ditylum_brightwellii.AAC.1